MRPLSETREFPGSDREPAHPLATSRSLLGRVQADEPDAWRRLVDLYAPLVYHWCRRGGLQGQDAADVFQDVFRAVVEHAGRFRKERDHFRKQNQTARGVGGSSAQERLAQLPERGPLVSSFR